LRAHRVRDHEEQENQKSKSTEATEEFAHGGAGEEEKYIRNEHTNMITCKAGGDTASIMVRKPLLLLGTSAQWPSRDGK
jgi:hypothetical protein